MTQKKAYVLGGYGFIGQACMRALDAAGYDVVGIGRSAAAAQARGGNWVILDIARTSADVWAATLADADIVVNASGALQDGAKDNLASIHEHAIAAIAQALHERNTVFLQISAAGAMVDASTEFMRSKARGDAILMESDLSWIVLRPVLVLGPEAYGGTALLRATAATPMIGMLAMPEARIQTIHVDDLADAVVQLASGELGTGIVADLGEENEQSLRELTEKMRRWLGYRPWRWTFDVPPRLLKPVSRIADWLGWLGWRAPLRSNAMLALRDGVTGDAATWVKLGGAPIRSLDQTLAALPATAQERVFARAYFLLPLAIATLSLFWIASGVIGVLYANSAKAVLSERGVSDQMASLAVFGGAGLDVLLGLAILWRRVTRMAAGGMIVLALGYLGAATLVTPDLWLDPLGPMVKVLPSIVLALFPLLLLERR